jgi:tryptophan synthase alpha chain
MTNSKLSVLFESRKKIISIYMMAGYPNLEDTIPLLEALQDSGVDLIEIGMPYSDPLADGPVIQKAGTKALKNGMNPDVLFSQLESLRGRIKVPLILMGYFNNVLQFGVEKFCKKAAGVGIAGLILPDLPFDLYLSHYRVMMDSYGLSFIPLLTPQTNDERIRMMDLETNGFLYAVSASATTGAQTSFPQQTLDYFDRLKSLSLKNPVMVGFGISSPEHISQVHSRLNGVIIGSAFIRAIEGSVDSRKDVEDFVGELKGG